MEQTRRVLQWTTRINGRVMYAGTHIVADFWHGKIIEDTKEIRTLLANAAKEAGNTPLEIAVHKFFPQGITGVVLLSESHIAIHTWPEIFYTAIDIFTCGGSARPQKALSYLQEYIKPEKVEIHELKRGRRG